MTYKMRTQTDCGPAVLSAATDTPYQEIIARRMVRQSDPTIRRNHQMVLEVLNEQAFFFQVE